MIQLRWTGALSRNYRLPSLVNKCMCIHQVFSTWFTTSLLDQKLPINCDDTDLKLLPRFSVRLFTYQVFGDNCLMTFVQRHCINERVNTCP